MLTYIKLILTALFWGGTFIAGRIVAKNNTPFTTAWLRFAIASLLLVILIWRIEGRIITHIDKKHIISVVLLGLTGIFSYNVFFFKGLQTVEAGRAATIISANPIFIALFSSLFFKERLNVIKVIGILLSVIGAILAISNGQFNPGWIKHFGWGELFIFGCVLSWAAYSLIGKTILTRFSPISAVTCSVIVGVIALSPFAYTEGIFKHIHHYTLLDWVSLFYLGIFGTVMGFVWYYEGIKKIGPTKASIFINFVPVSAVLLSFLILGESISLFLGIGALCVTAGVFLTNRKSRMQYA